MLNKRHVVLGTLTTAMGLPRLVYAQTSKTRPPTDTGERRMTARPEQLHQLLMYCIDFAKQMLEAKGAFYPFGAVLRPPGQLEARAGWNGEEHPDRVEIYKLLAGRFREQAEAGEITGAALAVDVNIPSQYTPKWPDGIRVRLEGADFSRYVYVPYQIEKSGILRSKHRVEFAEPFAVEVAHEFFLAKTD
jgi:hypothetical protein